MTILSVDDSATIRRIVKKTVIELGYDSMEAADGPSALRMLDENANLVNVVILDWNMPGMTGLEVLKQIKGNPKLAGVVVMMLTSEADQSFVLDALRNGAQNYLTKPFDAKLLQLKIQESLSLASKA